MSVKQCNNNANAIEEQFLTCTNFLFEFFGDSIMCSSSKILLFDIRLNREGLIQQGINIGPDKISKCSILFD